MPIGIYQHKSIPEEVRKKISIKMKGKRPYEMTDEIRKNISEGHKGQTPWNKDKTGIYSEETKNKIGKNNPNYKDGITLGEKRKEYIDIYNKDYKRRIRMATIDALGSKCIKCGFDDIRALQIDHINGGGCKELKNFPGHGKSYYKYVLESFLRGENKYQLLCANCNWIKRVENNEVKGK